MQILCSGCYKVVLDLKYKKDYDQWSNIGEIHCILCKVKIHRELNETKEILLKILSGLNG